MGRKRIESVDRGMKFIWYEREPGRDGSGGLGIECKRFKKSRSFFGVLPIEDVRGLYAFLGSRLKEGGKRT